MKKIWSKKHQNIMHGKQVVFSHKFFLKDHMYFLSIFVLILSCVLSMSFMIGDNTNTCFDEKITVSTVASSTPYTTSGSWVTNNRYADGFAGGSGTESDPYQISTASQLAYLAYTIYNDLAPVEKVTESDTNSNGQVTERRTFYYNYKDTYFELTNSINLSSYYWQPIGSVKDTGTSEVPNLHYRYFSGHFEGNNYSVVGIFTKEEMGQGLFGAVGAKSDSKATVSNLHVSGTILGLEQSAGLIGRAAYTDIKNCSSSATITSSSQHIGGIVGECAGTVNITDCWNLGTVKGGSYTGGITGYGPGSTTYINNCYNKGSITGGGHVGGIIGWGGQISDCYNSGSIKASSGTTGGTGGIVGGGTVVLIQRCYNEGNISSLDHVGGILGYASLTVNQYVKIYDCYNTATVNGGDGIGGIAGEIRYWAGANINISRCYNKGSLSGSSQVGGILGLAYKYGGEATISNCINIGSISGSPKGGIVGERTGSSLLGKITYTNNQYGGETNIGGVDGASTSGCTYVATLSDDIKTQTYFSTNFSTWDFSNVWTFESGKNLNHPVLKVFIRSYNIIYNPMGGYVNFADVEALEYDYTYLSETNTYTYNVGNLQVSYNPGTHYLTLNGSANYYTNLPSCGNMTFKDGAQYAVTMDYVSGSMSGDVGIFVIEIGPNISSNLTNRSKTDYNGPINGSISTMVTANSDAQNNGNALRNWFWNGDTSTFRSFNNYTVKLESFKVNDTSPIKIIQVEDVTHAVTTPFREGFAFKGYFSRPFGEGVKYFDENGVCVLQPEDDVVLYAAWEDVSTWLAHAADNFEKGSGTINDPYIIKTAEQLALLTKNVYYGFENNDGYIYQNKYFKQVADIDLSQHIWVPIGVYYNLDYVITDYNFAGVYDGGGYTISGIKMLELSGEPYNRRGLFGRVNGENSSIDVEIKNIVLTDSTITGGDYVGALIGYAGLNVSISNCTVDVTVSGTGQMVGGLVGSFDGLYITDCKSNGFVKGVDYIGGIAGTVSCQISNCTNFSTINASWVVGGIVGRTSGKTENCINYGYISTTRGSLGGIAGNSTGLINNCYNYTTIDGTAQDVSGIVGITQASVTNCTNSGKITSKNNGTTAGIVGTINLYSSQSVVNCHNIGDMSGGNGTGGIIGIICIYSGDIEFRLAKSANSGSINGGPSTGGIIGLIDVVGNVSGYSLTIEYCLNDADINSGTGAPYTVGGIVGALNGSTGNVVFRNCYTVGNLSVSGADGNIGGFIGRPYSNLSSNSNIYFEYCAAVVTTGATGSGTITNKGAFYSGWNGNQVVTKNSYVIMDGALSLSSVTSGMDNNFGYHANFQGGVPIPNGIYSISQFFTQTNIQAYLQNNF